MAVAMEPDRTLFQQQHRVRIAMFGSQSVSLPRVYIALAVLVPSKVGEISMLLARLTPGLLCYRGQEAEKCISPPPMLADFPSRLRSMQVAGLFA